MMGLIRKDLIMSRSGIAFMAFFSVAFVLTIGNGGISCIVPAVVFSSLASSSIAWDEQSNWPQYAVSVGISRDILVRSKFVLGLLFVMIGTLIGFLATFVVDLIGATPMSLVYLEFLVPSTVLAFATGVTVSAILLLVNYLIGNSVKAQYASVFVNVLCIASAVVMAFSAFNYLGDMWLAALSMLVVAALVTLISYRLSSTRFGSKDIQF